jgi:phosphoglycerate kinase
MKLRTYKQEDMQAKKVLLRVDFNVPLKAGEVADDTRITESIPNILRLLDFGARLALISHLGRPKGERKPEFSLEPVAQALERILKTKGAKVSGVTFVRNCIGPEVERAVAAQWRGDIVLLENSRFYPGEEKNDPEFAAQLAAPFDAFVNDAFGTAHRAHATTVGVTAHLPSFAGSLMLKETLALSRVAEKPDRPFVVITGGKKVSDKLPLLQHLCGRAEAVLVGGAMVFTLARAQGLATGKSLVEEDQIDSCKALLQDYRDSTTKLVLPEDITVTDNLKEPKLKENRALNAINSDEMGVDIGKQARQSFANHLSRASTIFWNGPMGVFETKPFDAGTIAVARAIAANKAAFSVVGGGESVEAVKKLGFAGAISHLSTGGGASLEFVSGLELPGLKALAL